ncbi:TonB-dependent receptor [Xanthocytophaga agilis]|uniref:TonB-dependent receptor n=1 Tax=Xanthocytophaga agilis TaxID=3048010 RepID=A0AAE3UFE4_9BACT|nr:TonB-dependent receptor [Xanthocytophaga agilis]MDJ1502336.1 TonB-dependent receptor [Xanthocytophaga agilis]
MAATLLTLITILNFSISGIVKDQATHKPIANATILLVETQHGTITNASGNFELRNIPSGNYTLRISHVGYATYEVKVNPETVFNGRDIFLVIAEAVTEEIIIQGIRADETTPVSQKTLTKAQIEQNYMGQEMPVLLTQTPSINYYSDAGNSFGYSYMRLRGIDQSRINFTLNGLPLNEPEDQGVYFANFADFGNSLQSIQVQRGIGTSTSGTASYAGSVNFESINLADSIGSLNLQTGYGSFGSYRISPEFSTGQLKNGFALYGRYSLLHTDGHKYHSGTHAHSGFISAGYFGKKDLFRLTAFTGHTRNDMAYVPVALTDIQQDPRTNYLSPEEKDKFSQQLVQLQHTHKFNQSTSLVTSGYYIHLTGGYDIRFDPILQNFSVASDFGGGMMTLHYTKDRLTTHVGVHANTYKRDHFSSIQPNTSDRLYTNTGYKKEISAFGKINYAWNKFNLFADAQIRSVFFRYSPEKSYELPELSTQWTFFNPKVGITYQAGPAVNVYASIGKTSREPTRNDLFAGFDDVDSSNISLIGDLTRIKPESVTDIEIGARWILPTLVVQANVYTMQFHNEIAPIGQLSYIGLPLRKNVAQSYRRGVEVDLSWKLLSNLSIVQNTAFMDAQIKEYTNDVDNQTYRNVNPLLSPKWILNQGVIYQLPFSKPKKLRGDVELSSRYVSKSFLANTNESQFMTPDFHLLNLRISMDFLQHVRFSFMANNLTDKLYFTSGQVTDQQPYYFVQARRNYFVTLQLNF